MLERPAPTATVAQLLLRCLAEPAFRALEPLLIAPHSADGQWWKQEDTAFVLGLVLMHKGATRMLSAKDQRYSWRNFARDILGPPHFRRHRAAHAPVADPADGPADGDVGDAARPAVRLPACRLADQARRDEVHLALEVGVAEERRRGARGSAEERIEVGSKEFMCVGANPPFDHPHVFLDLGNDNEIICPYCSTLYRYDPKLAATACDPAECLWRDAQAA